MPMSIEAISLIDVNSSKPFAFLTLATALTHVELYPSSGNVTFDLHSWADTNAVDIAEIVYPETYHTMIASERVLSRDWNQPDEDKAWADL